MIPEEDTEDGKEQVGFNPRKELVVGLCRSAQGQNVDESLRDESHDDTGNQHVVPHEDGKENVVADRGAENRNNCKSTSVAGRDGGAYEVHFKSFKVVEDSLFFLMNITLQNASQPVNRHAEIFLPMLFSEEDTNTSGSMLRIDYMEKLRGIRSQAVALPALAGILSAGLVLGVAELIGAFFTARATPLIALGSTFIDFTPPWLKDFAIATFGTGDKAALFVGMGLTITILAAALGVAAYRRWILGLAGVLALGIIVSLCVITRAGATFTDIIPTLVGTGAGLAALRWMVVSLRGRSKKLESSSDSAPSRRTFFVASGTTAALAASAAYAGKALSGIRSKINATRDSIKAPKPFSAAPALPANVKAPVDGTVPWLTPNKDFYRIDTALSVPQIDVNSWEIRVHGMVENEFTMTFQELLDSELVERHITLTCVSNPVGGNLAGNAKWMGYPLRKVLERAKPKDGANMVLSTSEDGFSASTPLSVLQDSRDSMLALFMNDEPLPLDHGYPVRMVVPGLYGYVSATKWVVDLEITLFEDKTAYWTDRGWSAEGPIKTMARVEVPASFAKVPTGKTMVAGSAWSQHRGITKVEVQIDNGPWQEVKLADEANKDTWRQWYLEVELEKGTHSIKARATDAKDGLQTEKRADPVPNGASGWQSVQFTAE